MLDTIMYLLTHTLIKELQMKLIYTLINKCIDAVAPYSVQCSGFGKVHKCWSFAVATEWIECYNTDVFGSVYVSKFGRCVAIKY